jgi:hypothetical protein
MKSKAELLLQNWLELCKLAMTLGNSFSLCMNAYQSLAPLININVNAGDIWHQNSMVDISHSS